MNDSDHMLPCYGLIFYKLSWSFCVRDKMRLIAIVSRIAIHCESRATVWKAHRDTAFQIFSVNLLGDFINERSKCDEIEDCHLQTL